MSIEGGPKMKLDPDPDPVEQMKAVLKGHVPEARVEAAFSRNARNVRRIEEQLSKIDAQKRKTPRKAEDDSQLSFEGV